MKLNIQLHKSECPHLVIHPRELNTIFTQNPVDEVFTIGLIIAAQDWKPPKCSSVTEWNKLWNKQSV